MKANTKSDTATLSRPRSSRTASAPTYDEIARRAYQVWESKGKPQGQDEANWREAERQLKLERGLL